MQTIIDRPRTSHHAEMTGDDLLQRARELVPMLQDGAPTSENLRRLAPESFAALRDAGLFKLYVPRRHGGFELSPLETIRIYSEVARGDGAAAWVTAIMSTNGWMAAQFPEAVQDLVFEDGDIRIVGVLGGGGGKSEAVAVDGGFLLSGFWPFCSGCHYAKWVMLGATVPVTGGAPEQRLFVVPQARLTIKDDWYTTALAGSGSNSVACKDVFVPSEHVLDLAAAAAGDAKDQLYRINLINFFAYQLVGPALGFARAAIEHFVNRATNRGVAYTFYQQQKEAPAAQLRLGEAMVKIAAATALAERDLEEMLAEAADEPPALLVRGQRRANASYVERLCLDVVETMYLAAGANSILATNPLQRIARDVHANNMHGIAALDSSTELLGRLRFGLDPNTHVI